MKRAEADKIRTGFAQLHVIAHNPDDVGGGADRTLGIPQVWLAPDSELQRFRVTPEVLRDALRQDRVRVLEINGAQARDITDAYRAGAVN